MIEIVRRTSHRQMNYIKDASLKIHLRNGRVSLTQKTCNILNVKDNEGVMFGFNKKEKSAYIIKDTEPDAFIIHQRDKNTFRFCCKELIGWFDEVYELSKTGVLSFSFNIDEQPNEKGMYKLILR